MRCLDDTTLAGLVDGLLDDSSARDARGHLDRCAACRELVADVLRAMPEVDDGRAPLRRGALVGRYVVLEPVGSGAMGLVYAAYDPELDRQVALKLLRPDSEGEPSLARAVLLREAQAMARLAHANVVAVYDVGTYADEVFIAMELARGGTLREWLGAAPRSWREIARVFSQAAAGLAAAHRADLVHRDFKPDNVLFTAEGVAKVTDFGLARLGEGQSVGALPEASLDAGEPQPSQSSQPSRSSRSPRSPRPVDTLYRPGSPIGTPAYMAPEQRAGGRGDAASDQYAFGVALHEALCGARPAANGQQTIASESSRRTPRWLLRLAARACRPAPSERFRDMDELGLALERGVARRRRGLWLAAIVAAAAGAAAMVLFGRFGPEPCQGAAAAWRDAWSDDARAAVRARFAQLGRESAFAGTAATLERYRDAWIEAHGAACRATRSSGAQSEQVLDLRMACLERHRAAASALVRVLREGDGAVAEKALSAAEALPPVEDCASVPALLAADPGPSDPALRSEIDALERAHADALAAHSTARVTLGLEEARAAVERARPLRHPALLARLLLVRGRLERASGALARAEETLHEAVRVSFVAMALPTAIDAWTALVHVAGFFGQRRAEALRWLSYAEALVERLGGDDGRRAELLLARAAIDWQTSDDFDEALAATRRARGIVARLYGETSKRVAGADGTLAGLLSEMGRTAEALPIFRRLDAFYSEVDGAQSGGARIARVNAASALGTLKRFDEAEALFRELIRTSPGPDPWTRIKLADVLRRQKRAREALAEDREALSIYERRGLGDAVQAIAALGGLGLDLLQLGRAAEALAPLEHALQIAARAEAPLTLADARFAVARALRATNQEPERARSLAETARRAYIKPAAHYGSFYADELRDMDAFLRGD